MNKALTVFLFNLVLQFSLYAQTPTIQDCLGAIPICERIYFEDFVKPGCGAICNEIKEEAVCGFKEEGSVWYTFTVNQSGDFGFIITPNQRTDDYDWALFNITNASCGDIYDTPSLLVSCNAAGDNNPNDNIAECSGATGATGATNMIQQFGGCGGDGLTSDGEPRGLNPFNDLIKVSKGNTYALMISNFSQSGEGYTIDFGLTDVGVIDNQAAEISSIEFPKKCKDRQINIIFNEKIKKNTIERLNNFELIGPKGEAYSFSNLEPTNFPDAVREFPIFLNEGLVNSGVYTFRVTTDGTNHILDNCDNPFPAGVYTFEFELNSPELPLVDLGVDTIICAPLTLNANNKEATYQWQDGTNSPTIMASTTGTYRVEVMNACGTVSDEIEVIIYDKPNINFGKDTLLCPNAILVLNAASDVADYQWQDDSENNIFTVTEAGTYQVIVTNLCGIDTEDINVTYRAPLAVELGNDTIICDGRSLPLIAYNEEANYQWQDNSTNENFIVENTGDYAVTVSNVCNSVSDTRSVILLDGPPRIEFGEDQRLCPNEELVLDASNQEATYRWQDGSTANFFNVTQLGIYEVTIDNACGMASDDIAIDYLLPLEVNLQKDFFLCQPTALLSTREHPDATYQWNNGHIKRALEIEAPGIYILEAATICETQFDTVVVSTCESCNVYMPNVFSPNNDGNNDLFKPFKEAGCELMDFQIRIFDRWGNQIFESNNPENGWNGQYQNRVAVASVYIWQMQYQVEQNGEIIAINKVGNLTLLPSSG